MQRYILGRLIQGVVCIWGVTIIVFVITHLTGDPAALLMGQEASQEKYEFLRQELGLDKPILAQYGIYLRKLVSGDLGYSWRWRAPAARLIMEALPNTMQLAGLAMLLAVTIGVATGILSAVRRGGYIDRFGKTFAILGQSLPTFWVGLILILVFSVRLRLLPTSGMGGLDHMIMPSLTLAWYSMAALTRLTRSAMLDVLDSEYVKMARIVGVPEIWVICKHALKNASIPVVGLFGIQIVSFLSGSVIVETIFAWPGLGRLAVDAIFARDFPVVQGVVLLTSFLYITSSFIVDILYGYLDPRIRYE